MKIPKNRWVWGAGGAAVLAAGVLFGLGGEEAGEFRIETAAIERGTVRRTVSTSGTVQALVTVEVGSQLSGQIETLSADFNDTVKEGDVIATLDPRTFKTRVLQAEADVEVAGAGLASQQANLAASEAQRSLARQALERQQELFTRGNVSQSLLEDAQAKYEVADANVTVAESQIRNSEALLRQREAALQQASIDYERAFIRSPIDGVIIERSIDVGQTVAASFSAPVLFTIANDLRDIQIEASVDEADIGFVRSGNPVSFQVDAFPGRGFTGEVKQVRLAPVNLQNVVTYTVVISARNEDLSLLPGMTATVDIVTGESANVPRVPNAALLFRPSDPSLIAESSGGSGDGGGRMSGFINRVAQTVSLSDEQRDQLQEEMGKMFSRARQQASQGGGGGAGGPPSASNRQAMMDKMLSSVLTADQMELWRQSQTERPDNRRGSVWVQNDDGKLERRGVRLGISDDSTTELVGERGITAGDEVVVRARKIVG